MFSSCVTCLVIFIRKLWLPWCAQQVLMNPETSALRRVKCKRVKELAKMMKGVVSYGWPACGCWELTWGTSLNNISSHRRCTNISLRPVDSEGRGSLGDGHFHRRTRGPFSVRRTHLHLFLDIKIDILLIYVIFFWKLTLSITIILKCINL